MEQYTTKTCTKCRQPFPATPEHFYRNKSRCDGLTEWCKTCTRQYQQKYYQEHPDKRPKYSREYSHEYYEAHKEKILAQSAAWRERNHETWAEKNRQHVYQWRAENPEKAKESRRKYKETHKEEIKQRRKDYEAANPEKIKEQRRKSREKRYLDVKAGANNQRAKMRKSRGRIVARDIYAIYDSQNGKCWWCGKELNGKFDLDHIMPLSKGGSNELNNLCASCPECNSKKHDKMPWEFAGRLF